MQVSDICFQAQWRRLALNYLSAADEDTVKGKRALYAEMIGRTEWITDVVLTEAVRQLLDDVPGRLPEVADFKAACAYAKDRVDLTARRAAVALPTPLRREVDEVDPNDPYSCTPAERERWAREDTWIRGWATRLKPTPPDILECLSVDDRAYFVDADQRNASVANWPNLKPAERRAKERRIEIQRRAAMKQIAATLGKPEPIYDELPPLYGIPTQPKPEPVEAGPLWPVK